MPLSANTVAFGFKPQSNCGVGTSSSYIGSYLLHISPCYVLPLWRRRRRKSNWDRLIILIYRVEATVESIWADVDPNVWPGQITSHTFGHFTYHFLLPESNYRLHTSRSSVISSTTVFSTYIQESSWSFSSFSPPGSSTICVLSGLSSCLSNSVNPGTWLQPLHPAFTLFFAHVHVHCFTYLNPYI